MKKSICRILQQSKENAESSIINSQCTLTPAVAERSALYYLPYVVILIGITLTVIIVFNSYIRYKMKKEIKSEVNETLDQYYRYLDTFQEGEELKLPKYPHASNEDMQAEKKEEVELAEVNG